MYHELELEKTFDTAYGIIKIPANTIFYRGYSTLYPPISKRFAYFSEKHVANSYIKSHEYTLSAFMNTHTLHVMDVRFMMSILRDMIYSNRDDESSLPIVLSFGLCSLRHQVNLLNMRYRHSTTPLKGHVELQKIVDSLDPASPYEPQGVRVGETTNDAYTMAFLSELFGNLVDGYISPRLVSPFHVDNKNSSMVPELLIFNPFRSGIRQLSKFPPSNTPKVSLSSIYSSQLNHHVVRYKNNVYETSFYLSSPMIGGGDSEIDIPSVEQINEHWDDEEIQNEIQNGKTNAQKWKERLSIRIYEHPVPEVSVSPWTVVSDVLVPVPKKTRKTRKNSHKTL
jgi:hypothetical protein